jgi:hypothetical protein
MKQRSLEAKRKTGSGRVTATSEESEVIRETGRQMVAARKRGRPEMSAESALSADLRIRCTIREKENLTSYCQAIGISASEYLRNLLLAANPNLHS